eukprot:6177475-Pleurochrysis_carterae.AAC.5
MHLRGRGEFVKNSASPECVAFCACASQPCPAYSPAGGFSALANCSLFDDGQSRSALTPNVASARAVQLGCSIDSLQTLVASLGLSPSRNADHALLLLSAARQLQSTQILRSQFFASLSRLAAALQALPPHRFHGDFPVSAAANEQATQYEKLLSRLSAADAAARATAAAYEQQLLAMQATRQAPHPLSALKARLHLPRSQRVRQWLRDAR